MSETVHLSECTLVMPDEAEEAVAYYDSQAGHVKLAVLSKKRPKWFVLLERVALVGFGAVLASIFWLSVIIHQ